MNSNRIRRSALIGAVAVAFPLSLALPLAASADSMPGPFGPACASVPKQGAGSFDGMAKDPVATAASHNPALSTLVAAVKKAGLVDTLNNAKNITVFAPTNDAFSKIPKNTLDKAMNDKATLTKILTYHVVGQKITPSQLSKGSFKSLEGATLTASGSASSYKVNGSANVVCGNVPTANATVYIIDSVLMPPS
ncbi:fasciclin domain-containing protein [Streptomyces sp. NPDC001691]|uniref:fasciclin domain-containing protein n=1 Tax=unclassified Streptomyces TaxID=2593676 RepID=UPI000DEB4352|nr:fasciclin domain-containing protein [Streptomyces sp. SDr-06]RCH59686.1 fasciclin domain-containing protein [Streptomyces sp. SDr-06]